MKKLTTLFLALLCSLSVFSQISESEKSALTDLYHATQGDHWNMKWDLSGLASELPGVTVENGHVTEIRMLFNNLDGILPTTLDRLTELKVLELSFNKISGTLPSSLGSLSKLETLALNGNSLTGSIPASIGNLNQLKQLHLSSNKLSGELPNTLHDLKNLKVFNVFDNNLSGFLPLVLANSRSIREFIVAENNFSNTAEISAILLKNSGGHVDLKGDIELNPPAKSVIAVESEDGN